VQKKYVRINWKVQFIDLYDESTQRASLLQIIEAKKGQTLAAAQRKFPMELSTVWRNLIGDVA
jgi:hypothetical protein